MLHGTFAAISLVTQKLGTNQIVRNRRQMSLLILTNLSQLSNFLFPLKSLENLRLSGDFKGNRSLLAWIRLMLQPDSGDDP